MSLPLYAYTEGRFERRTGENGPPMVMTVKAILATRDSHRRLAPTYPNSALLADQLDRVIAAANSQHRKT